MAKRKSEWPEDLGACIDQLQLMRKDRQAQEKLVKEMKAREDKLEEHIIEKLKMQKLDGAKGKRATAAIQKKTVAQVTDWEALFDYIMDKDAFELIQRRVNNKAYLERLDAKQRIPGVEPFHYEDLSLTTLKGK
jgi:hypothetical protein